MIRFLFGVLLLAPSFNLLAEDCEPSENCIPQIEAKDARAIYETAYASFDQLYNYLYRTRELAIQATNGAVGNTERGYLNDEFSAISEEIQRLFLVTRATDQFGYSWRVFSEGYHFLVPISYAGGRFSRRQEFEFHPTPMNEFGSEVRRDFDLIESEESMDKPAVFKFINSARISTQMEDDSVSNRGNLNSAIALAAAINRNSTRYGVGAEVLPNRVLVKTNSRPGAILGGLKSGELFLNGVSVTGAASSTVELIESLNEMSLVTGVSASFVSNPRSFDEFELVATDGRNIDVKIEGERANEIKSYLGLRDDPIFLGSIRLYSRKPFVLESISSPLAQGDSYIVVSDRSPSFFAQSLQTQEAASDALRSIDSGILQLNEMNILVSELGGI